MQYTMSQRADLGARFLAAIIDGIILGVITGLLVGVGREAGGVVSFLIGLLYHGYFWTRQEGQTPGKKAMGIRVVKMDGSPLREADALVRFVGYTINSVVAMIGWIWVFIDKDHRGWHDLFAGTMVVRA